MNSEFTEKLKQVIHNAVARLGINLISSDKIDHLHIKSPHITMPHITLKLPHRHPRPKIHHKKNTKSRGKPKPKTGTPRYVHDNLY